MNTQNTQTQKKTSQQILEEIKQKALAIQSGLSNQPQTQTTPQATTISPRAEAFNKYVEASTPTQEEKDYQSRISSIMGKREATDIRVGDEPISAQAMAGRREMLTREEQAQLVPMQRQLAILQGQRQASLDTQKLRYEDEKSKEESRGKTATVGKSLYQYDPTTNSYKLAVEGPKEYQSGSIGEYEYYRDNEIAAGRKPMGYNEYQNLDANRKRAIVQTGLTQSQINQSFLTISNKYQADSIINQAINGKTASAIADQIIADPSKATNQLASLYLLVKNLDPTSAVREGELALANQTQSYLQIFSNSLKRISEGRVIAPGAAKALAEATKNLTRAWETTADRRQKQYIAQATTAGVGNEFTQYLGGYESSFGGNNEEEELMKLGYTPEQIQQIKSAQ